MTTSDWTDVVKDFTVQKTIKINADWINLTGPDEFIDAAAGDDIHGFRWTLGRMGMHGYLNAGEKFIVTVQDSLAALTTLNMNLQGFLLPDTIPGT